MTSSELSRRQFARLSALAASGLILGVRIAEAEEKSEPPKKEEGSEKHLCRGLNTCKGQGGCGESKAKNSCAGTGECATVKHHACRGKNECKGSGGGPNAGLNACKGKGGCAVPLNPAPWGRARARLAVQLQKSGKKLGDPPPKKK